MAKTWFNHPCGFSTKNSENALGDSRYMVTINNMTRIANINVFRAPDQVNTGNPSICYLIQDSKLYNRVMHTLRDEDIIVDVVILNTIIINADGFKGQAYRIPQNGYVPFDFVNQNGILSHIHIGHKLYNLS